MNKVNHHVFQMYCDHIRSRLNVRGTIIYSEKAERKLKVAGWPFLQIIAVNDNEASP